MKKISLFFLCLTFLTLIMSNCGPSQSLPSPIPSTQTPLPATVTSVPPTQTPLPATVTSVPSTQTPLPASAIHLSPSPTLLSPAGSVKMENPQRYRVEYIATVRNKGYALNRLVVYQPRPVEWDSQKSVTVEVISPTPSKEGVDPILGNGIYYWQVQELPKQGESLAFRLQFTYMAYEIATKIDPDEVRPYNQADPSYRLFTRAERYIESADPKIIEVANQIAAGEMNPYRLARKFYDYVIVTANYHLLGKGLLGAKTLITTGQGECGDYASLFVALSRAKGIPARPVVGYWALSGIEQTHVWAEFYLEGVGWIPVDPTVGQSQSRKPGKLDYYFGNMDNQRVILNKGFNIQLDPPAPNNYVAPFLQVPLWWYWGASGDGNAMSIERTSWKVALIP